MAGEISRLGCEKPKPAATLGFEAEPLRLLALEFDLLDLFDLGELSFYFAGDVAFFKALTDEKFIVTLLFFSGMASYCFSSATTSLGSSRSSFLLGLGERLDGALDFLGDYGSIVDTFIVLCSIVWL